MQMHDARIKRSLPLETAVREYFQHLAILTQHVGFEFLDAIRIRDPTQMMQQDRADTASLELVQNRKRNLSTLRIGAAYVPTNADETLASGVGQRRDQAGVRFEIELRQVLQIGGRQIAPDSHETKINRLPAQTPEMLMQAFLIVRTNRANSDRAAVDHPRVDTVVARVARYFSACHFSRRV